MAHAIHPPIKPGDIVTCFNCDGKGAAQLRDIYGTPMGKVIVCRFCDGTGVQVVQE